MPKPLKDWAGRPSGQEPLPKVISPRDMIFVDHLHMARKAGTHHDIRVGDPLTGQTWNWATRKGLPPPGKAHELYPTGRHPLSYLSFRGQLTGYGQGTVDIARKETAKVLESGPGKMQIALPEGRVPETFTISQRDGRWFVHNTTPSKDVKVWQKLVPLERPKYREKSLDSVDIRDSDSIATPKIDGASGVLALRSGKMPRLFSARIPKDSARTRGKVPGAFLEHSLKVPGLIGSKSPEGGDTALRGEIYGVSKDTGRPIPARELGGLLNALTPKSIRMQEERGVELKLMPFDLIRYKGRDASGKPYDEKLRLIREISGKLPFLTPPEAAESPQDKARMIQAINAGEHPLTREGVVLWDKKTGVPTKIKPKPDYDVEIKDVFPSKREGYAGGFTYLFGGAEGKVGTGFSDKMKRDMAEHPGKYKGLVAKVRAQEVFPSGKLRAPAFKEWHLDKNEPKRLEKTSALKTQLQPQQQRVVERMGQQHGLVVAHGLGSGKTLTSIAVQESMGTPAAIVVPASLKANYLKELQKHVTGKKLKRDITSMQMLARSKESPKAPLLIIDEAHRIREPGTSTHGVLGKAEAGKRLLLTASPFYNRPSDISSLVNVAAGEKLLPEGKAEFEKAYIDMKKIKPGFWGWLRGIKPGTVPTLKQKEKGKLKDIFSTWVDYHPGKTDDFPSVSKEVVEVPMGKEQMRLYSALMSEAPPWVRYKVRQGLPPSKTEAKQLNAFLAATRQVSNTTEPFASAMAPEQPKIDEAIRRLKGMLKKEPAAKALVYSNFLKSGIEPYKRGLEKAGIPYGEFTGEIKKKERDRLVDQYNKGKLKVLLASSAGGEGLDLKGTRLVQLLDPHWNWEKLKQVEGRGIRYKSHAHLPEDQRNVHVQQFLATRSPHSMFERWRWKRLGGSVDQYLQRMSQEKEDVIKQFRGLVTGPGKIPAAD